MSEVSVPQVRLADVHVDSHPRYSAEMRVTPLWDRHPDFHWRFFFVSRIQAVVDVVWKEAGFVLCGSDEIDRVTEVLREVAIQADADFANLLNNPDPSQNQAANDLAALEGISAASADGPYRVVRWI